VQLLLAKYIDVLFYVTPIGQNAAERLLLLEMDLGQHEFTEN